MSAPVAPPVPALRLPAFTVKSAPATPARAPLPLPTLAVRRTSATVYGSSSIDHSGRLSNARIMRQLAWSADLALTWTAGPQVLLITPDPAGTFHLTTHGHVCIPAPLQHLCALRPGDRVVLAADPIAARLTIYPPAGSGTQPSPGSSAITATPPPAPSPATPTPPPRAQPPPTSKPPSPRSPKPSLPSPANPTQSQNAESCAGSHAGNIEHPLPSEACTQSGASVRCLLINQH